MDDSIPMDDPDPMQSQTVKYSMDQPPSISGTVSLNGLAQQIRVGLQLGNYRIVQLLATGGFADVYLGEHVYLNTHAAIKILRNQLAAEDLKHFREEARMVARLRHPHIISILDFDVQNGTPFIVMDYAPNGMLRQRHPRGSIIQPADILPYLAQLADALQFAHLQGLVHRDVKPENMLIGARNEILLSDFGIALALQTIGAEAKLEVIGTAAYMAPEQFSGMAFPASDQYALAVVVYEWLCGRCPFYGSIAEIAAQHLNTHPSSIRQFNPYISSDLDSVLQQALAKRPEQRYPGIMDFFRAFQSACPQQILILRQPVIGRELAIQPQNHMAETIRAQLAPVPLLNEASWQPAASLSRKGRSVSRRTVLISMAGLASVGLVGSGLTLFLRSGSAFSTKSPSAFSTKSPSADVHSLRGQLLIAYHRHTDGVVALAWSPPGGQYIASASQDSTVRVWQSSSGTDVRRYTGHYDTVNAVAWSPDAAYIASASNDLSVHVWSPMRNAPAMGTYMNHQGNVNTVSWSPNINSRYIASGSNDTTVHIWSGQDGSDVAVYTKHSNSVRCVAWSPSPGTYIASGSADNTVQVWYAPVLETPPPDSILPLVTFTGHNDTVNAVAWSPNGQLIASGSADKTVQIWDPQSGGAPLPLVTYKKHTAGVNTVAWSPDGRFIVSGSDDGRVRIWKATDGSDVYTYSGHGSAPVYAVAWSFNGTSIASAGADKTVQVWST